jgi:hypothetical protein
MLINSEWKDGLLTSLLRKLCIQPASTNYDLQATGKMKIIQLDGEVDPGQMELLSAVLNNDGAVVLGNSERIIIPETVRFIWEVRFLFINYCSVWFISFHIATLVILIYFWTSQ